MAIPIYATVLSQINTYIVANGNNEITANVLNPILKIMLDFANNNIGDLDTLTTDEKNSVVEAINSLKQNFDDLVNNGVQLYTGINDPNVMPPPTYNYADFYMQLDIDSLPVKLWQWNGFNWTDESGEPATESDNVINNSDVDGVTVTDALNTLDVEKASLYADNTIGDIYNMTSWNGLNDFTSTGSFAITDSKITVPSSSSAQLNLNYITCIDKYKLQFKYIATNGLKSVKGLAIGFISQNTASPLSHYAYFVESGANAGKIAMYSSYDAVTSYSSTAIPVYDSGDEIRLSIEDIGGLSYILTASNITKNTSISFNLNTGTSGTLQAFLHNTSKPSIISFNDLASYEVSEIQYSSTYKKGGMLGFGDSITQGFHASLPVQRWTDLIGAQNAGGAGDRSTDLLLRLDEVVNTVRPKTVYLAIGTNDGDIDLWKSNYSIIVSKLESNGIEVIKMTPTPNNIADLTAYKNYVLTTYPTTSIDVFTPLATGTVMNPIYTTDGVHPNSAGHTVYANTILASSLYSVKTYYSKLDPNIDLDKNIFTSYGFLPKATVKRGFVNSQMFDDGTNVGIGTDKPLEKLSLYSLLNANFRMERGAKAQSALVLFKSANEAEYLWSMGVRGASDNLSFWREGVSPAVAFTINESTKNFLIGTETDNGNKLRVVGGATELDQLKYKRALEFTGDLNNLNDAGFYIGSDMTNAPGSASYYITVERAAGSSDYAHQIATSVGFGNTPNIMYSRTQSGSGVWSSWKEIAYADNLPTSGTYTPTLTNVTNATGLITQKATYTRIGNIVNVHVAFEFNNTAVGVNTRFSITLPINRSTSIYFNMGSGSVVSSNVPNDIYPAILTSGSASNVTVYFVPLMVATSYSGSVNFQYSVLD